MADILTLHVAFGSLPALRNYPFAIFLHQGTVKLSAGGGFQMDIEWKSYSSSRVCC